QPERATAGAGPEPAGGRGSRTARRHGPIISGPPPADHASLAIGSRVARPGDTRWRAGPGAVRRGVRRVLVALPRVVLFCASLLRLRYVRSATPRRPRSARAPSA